MRTLVLALVVANAAFFSWRYNEQVEAKIAAARPVTPLSSDAPTLQLVSEVDELPPPRSVPAPAAPAAPTPTNDEAAPIAETPTPGPAPLQPSSTGTPSGVCARIGPFATAGEYSSIQQWLGPRSTSLRLERTSSTKRQLFWVYLEPKDASEAKANIADLRKKGVQDYLLINRNGLKNAISLGVFSSQDAVNRRLAEMTKQGYSPLVVPRIESTDMHWLNVEFATGYDDLDSIPADVRGNAGVETLDCTRLSGTPANPEA